MLLKNCSIKIKCNLENGSEIEVGAEAGLEIGEGLEEAHELLYSKVLKSVLMLTDTSVNYYENDDDVSEEPEVKEQ